MFVSFIVVLNTLSGSYAGKAVAPLGFKCPS